MTTSQKTPFSDEAEKEILSCFFTHPARNLPDFASTMSPEAFYHPANRIVYDFLQEMFQAGKPIELTSVFQYISQAGKLDAVGGPAALAEMARMSAQDLYAYNKKILGDLLTLRNIIRVCDEGRELAYGYHPADDVSGIISQFEQQVLGLRTAFGEGESSSFRELVLKAMDRYEIAITNNGALPGIPTGYSNLDKATGGMRGGQVWTIGGGTSDGKSAFVGNIVAFLGKTRVPSCLYTLEMTEDENVDRWFSMESCVAAHQFLYGLANRESQKATFRASQEMMQWPTHVKDVSGINFTRLRADMRSMVRRHGIKVFALDYLQLVSADRKGHSREQELAAISMGIKTEAKLLDVTVINLTQLNDEGKIRESRAIGHDSDVLGVLRVPVDEESGEKDEGRRELFLGKNRGGPRGLVLHFKFDGPTYTFREMIGPEKPSAPAKPARKRYSN